MLARIMTRTNHFDLFITTSRAALRAGQLLVGLCCSYRWFVWCWVITPNAAKTSRSSTYHFTHDVDVVNRSSPLPPCVGMIVEWNPSYEGVAPRPIKMSLDGAARFVSFVITNYTKPSSSCIFH